MRWRSCLQRRQLPARAMPSTRASRCPTWRSTMSASTTCCSPTSPVPAWIPRFARQRAQADRLEPFCLGLPCSRDGFCGTHYTSARPLAGQTCALADTLCLICDLATGAAAACSCGHASIQGAHLPAPAEGASAHQPAGQACWQVNTWGQGMRMRGGGGVSVGFFCQLVQRPS